MSWAESAVQGYRDIGQPAHDGGSHSSGGTVEGTAAPTPAWSVPWCRKAWLARLRAPVQGLDPVAVASCKSAVSVGEDWWSGPPRTASVPDSSATLSRCFPTALLHCPSASRQLLYTVPVPPDSSSTLSQCLPTAPLHCPSASRQLLYSVS